MGVLEVSKQHAGRGLEGSAEQTDPSLLRLSVSSTGSSLGAEFAKEMHLVVSEGGN